MTRRLALGLALGALLATLASAQEERRAVSIPRASLPRAFELLEAAGWPQLIAGETVKDQRVTVRLREDADPATFRKHLGELLEYDWRHNSRDEWELHASQERRTLAARRREERRLADITARRRATDLFLALLGPADVAALAREQLKGFESELFRVDKTPTTQAALKLLAMLSPAQRDRIHSGEAYISAPLATLPPDVSELVDQAFLRENRLRRETTSGERSDGEAYRRVIEVDEADLGRARLVIRWATYVNTRTSQGLCVRLLEVETNRTILGSPPPHGDRQRLQETVDWALIPPLEDARWSTRDRQTNLLTAPGPDQDDPVLSRRITLPPFPTRKLDEDRGFIPTRGGNILAAIAGAADLNLIADSYVNDLIELVGRTNRWAAGFVDEPIWRILRLLNVELRRKMNGDSSVDYRVEDGWLLVRHRNWDVAELYEPTVDEMGRLAREMLRDPNVSLKRQQEWLRRLGPEKYDTVAVIFPWMMRSWSFSLMAWEALTPNQQAAAQRSPISIPMSEISPARQQLLVRGLRELAPFASLIAPTDTLRVSGSRTELRYGLSPGSFGMSVGALPGNSIALYSDPRYPLDESALPADCFEFRPVRAAAE